MFRSLPQGERWTGAKIVRWRRLMWSWSQFYPIQTALLRLRFNIRFSSASIRTFSFRNACTTTGSTLFVGARSKTFPNGNRGRLSWSNRKVAWCDRQNRPQKFFKNIEVPFALDLLSIWAENGFRRIRCCQGFHTSKLVASVVLRGRLAGLILAKSTLSHVLSAAMPIKKTTSARLPPLETFPTRNRA